MCNNGYYSIENQDCGDTSCFSDNTLGAKRKKEIENNARLAGVFTLITSMSLS